MIDPQGGVRRPLKFYGGPNNVKETVLITKHSLAAHVPPPPAPTAAPSASALAGATPLLAPAGAPPPSAPAGAAVYSVNVAGTTIASGLDFDAAVTNAEEAASVPGVMAEVVDSEGATVEIEFRPALPPPIATPDPKPVTPLPDQPVDMWGLIDRIAVGLALFARGVSGQTQR